MALSNGPPSGTCSSNLESAVVMKAWESWERCSVWELGQVCLRSERSHGLFWQMRPRPPHLQFFQSFTVFFISIGRADENIEVEEIREKMKSIRLILRPILYIYISESFCCIPETDIVNQLQLKIKKSKNLKNYFEIPVAHFQ